MSEYPFSEASIYQQYIPHPDPLMDIHLRLKAMERISITVDGLENKGQLSAEIRVEAGRRRQDHLVSLGIETNYNDGMLALHRRLFEARIHPPVPLDFPSKEEFIDRIAVDITKPKFGTRLLHELTQNRESKPVLTLTNSLASEVAKYGQQEWWTLQPRGYPTLGDYIYQVALFVVNEYPYTVCTLDYDDVLVDENWQVVQGRHRGLALRALGKDYALQHGIDNWVTVRALI